mmetsp:Transcript_1003/g.2331  ORF Transcript_1003/g.2331 Transcript_1003/m.2331 type:complete len:269 (+) Transcript_1003:2456-3262(+)
MYDCNCACSSPGAVTTVYTGGVSIVSCEIGRLNLVATSIDILSPRSYSAGICASSRDCDNCGKRRSDATIIFKGALIHKRTRIPKFWNTMQLSTSSCSSSSSDRCSGHVCGKGPTSPAWFVINPCDIPPISIPRRRRNRRWRYRWHIIIDRLRWKASGTSLILLNCSLVFFKSSDAPPTRVCGRIVHLYSLVVVVIIVVIVSVRIVFVSGCRVIRRHGNEWAWWRKVDTMLERLLVFVGEETIRSCVSNQSGRHPINLMEEMLPKIRD